jgi:hypothetical protein
MFSCARICVEVDLKKGLPEAILLTLTTIIIYKHSIMSSYLSSAKCAMNMVIFPNISKTINRSNILSKKRKNNANRQKEEGC